MARKLSGHEVIWAEGPPALAFLVDRWGFLGPEVLPGGIGYSRSDLHIQLRVWSHHVEAGVATSIRWTSGDTRRSAGLDCLYMACGLGPAQHVPGSGRGSKTISKRVLQHAQALRLVIPYLNGPEVGELMRRCHARSTPA